MKMLKVDIDKFEDFCIILKAAETVLFVDVQNMNRDVLMILPQAAFPVAYTCHVPSSSAWRKNLPEGTVVIEATLEFE